MSFTKILDTDLIDKGVIGLPDQPGLSTAAMQNKLEETARSVIIPKHNGLIDELHDTTAAGNIGAVAPTGLTGTTTQALINELAAGAGSPVKDAYKNIESGGSTIVASGEDTFKINAGSNVTITPLASPDKGISISVNGGGGTSLGDMLMNDYDRDGSVKAASSTGNGIKDFVNTGLSGKANVSHTHTKSEITDFPTLATVATTGAYSDLSGKPSLATVATSGSYNDLSNKPTIPIVTDIYSGTSSDGMSGKAVKDAIDGITFPVNDAYKSVKVTSGGSSTTITASSEDTIELEAGSNVTLTATGKSIKIDSTGGGGGGGGSYTASKGVVISGSDIEASLAGYTPGSEAAAAYGSTANRTYAVGLDSNNKLAVNIPLSVAALSGSYADLTGRPSLATVATSGSYNDLSNKPSLATVATSGSYNDLSNKPTLATVATSGSYNDLSSKPTIPSAANSASLYIQQNGVSAYTGGGSFDADSSTAATANIVTDEWVTTTGTDGVVQSDGTVTFSGLNDSYGYDLYFTLPNGDSAYSYSKVTKSGSGTATTLVFTTDAPNGTVCKLRIIK